MSGRDIRRMYEKPPMTKRVANEVLLSEKNEGCRRVTRKTNILCEAVITLAIVGAGTVLYAMAWLALRVFGVV